jgi:predicted small metal-binding protein
MAYTIACADAGVECPAVFTTEDRGELMEHAVAHQKFAHKEVELNNESMSFIDSLVKSV